MARRRKSWVIDKTVLWNEYENGRRTTKQLGFNSAREAKKYAEQLSARMTLDLLKPDITPIRLQDAAAEFLAAHLDAGDALGTRRMYATTLGRLYRITGDIPVGDLNASHVDRLLADLRKGTCTGQRKPAADATVARHYRNVRSFLRWCVNHEYAKRDVSRLVTRKPKQNTEADRPRLEDQDIAAIVAACETADQRIHVLIGATTGIDRKQVDRIVGDDIDWTAGHFRPARVKVGKKYSPPIHDDLLDQLRRRALRNGPRQRLLSVGHYQSHYRDRDWFQRAAKRAGLDGVQYKDLRKYATRFLIASLGSFEEASKRLHSSVQTTMKHYFQPDPQAQRKVSTHPLPGSLESSSETRAG
ncbi:MAG: hypothetical protein IID34_01135 [Planctomycetes bacterium]|nr:hypothetical protein [Planctomycetota bacterium]